MTNATGVKVAHTSATPQKRSDIVPNHDKSYTAKFRLGMTTDTLDIWGAATSQSNKTATEADVLSALLKISEVNRAAAADVLAIKVNGQRLTTLQDREKKLNESRESHGLQT